MTADVLVIGAGPTGLVTAIELARHGVAVQVLDREPARAPTESRALSINARSQEIAERAGVLAPLRAAAGPVDGLSIQRAGRRIGRLDLTGLDSPHPAMVLLRQAETEAVLLERLRALGVEVVRPAELVGLTQDADGVTAELAGGAEVRARWLVGADGGHSRVRKALGVRFDGEASGVREYLADVRVEWTGDSAWLAHARREMFALLGPPTLLMFGPIGGGRWRMLAMSHADDPRLAHDRPAVEVLQALVDSHPGLDGRLADMTWSSAFGQSARKVDAMRHGRVFLAGDAAHIQSPFGGQGMNTGIGDAANLAWKLALVVHGHTRGTAAEALLDSYHAERDPVAAQLLRVATSGVEGFLAADAPAARLVRDGLLGTWGRVPPAVDLARRWMAGHTVHHRASPVVDEHVRARDRTPRAGDRAPDAGGVGHGGRVVRLHEVWAGDPRHQLLVVPAGPADPARLAELRAFADGLARRSAPLLAAHVVAPDGLRDTAGELRARYGAARDRLYLVRPDGHLGFRGTPARASALHAHLDRLVAPGG